MSMMTLADSGVRVAGLGGIRAAAFDLNGTITHDDELQYEVYAEVFKAEVGICLSAEEFLTSLAALPDPEIIASVLTSAGIPRSAAMEARIARIRVARYVDRVRSAPPVRPGAAALIKALARRIPVTVVTGAPRGEAAPVLAAAGLTPLLLTVITIEDVARGKPAPDGYLLALRRLRAVVPGLVASEVVVFEDSQVGITAAQAAGMKCVAAHLPPHVRPPVVDHIADSLDEYLLGDDPLGVAGALSFPVGLDVPETLGALFGSTIS